MTELELGSHDHATPRSRSELSCPEPAVQRYRQSDLKAKFAIGNSYAKFQSFVETKR